MLQLLLVLLCKDLIDLIKRISTKKKFEEKNHVIRTLMKQVDIYS